MSTWTFRGCVLGALCCALTGCDGFAGLNIGGGGIEALPSARLGRGAVALVPPSGFCVDKRSLRPSFALMARCDTLGAKPVFDAPLAIITATATTYAEGTVVTADDLGTGSEEVLDRADLDGFALVKVQGTPPDPAMHDVFWRTVGQVGDQVLSLAVYEANGKAQLGAQAPALLAQTMRRTMTQTASVTAQRANNSAPPPAKPIGNAVEASLSE